MREKQAQDGYMEYTRKNSFRWRPIYISIPDISSVIDVAQPMGVKYTSSRGASGKAIFFYICAHSLYTSIYNSSFGIFVGAFATGFVCRLAIYEHLRMRSLFVNLPTQTGPIWHSLKLYAAYLVIDIGVEMWASWVTNLYSSFSLSFSPFLPPI